MNRYESKPPFTTFALFALLPKANNTGFRPHFIFTKLTISGIIGAEVIRTYVSFLRNECLQKAADAGDIISLTFFVITIMTISLKLWWEIASWSLYISASFRSSHDYYRHYYFNFEMREQISDSDEGRWLFWNREPEGMSSIKLNYFNWSDATDETVDNETGYVRYAKPLRFQVFPSNSER